MENDCDNSLVRQLNETYNINDISSNKEKETNFINSNNTNSLFEINLFKKNNPKIYICKNCNIFPKIKIIDENTISQCCKDEDNTIKKLDKMLKYNMTEINSEEHKLKLQKETGCNQHSKIFQCYCNKCEKNLCEECYNICSEDIDHKMDTNSENIFLHFDILEKKIKYKEEYIINSLYNLFERDNKINQNKSNNNKKNIQGFEVPKLKQNEIINKIEDENGNPAGEIREKSLGSYYDYTNLIELIEILIYNKKFFPNYSHYLNISNFYDYLCEKLEIEYYSYLDQSEQDIRIFGNEFVENNKNNCHLIINGKTVNLCEKYKIKENEKLKIILIKDCPIIDMSKMFYECDFLSCISDNSKWTTDDVINMSYMFYGCIALNSLPEIFFQWNTSKVTDLSYMFNKCESMEKLPDISKWETKSVTNLSHIFSGCEALEKLPNISRWNISNVTDMSYMFNKCFSLEEICDLSDWDTKKVNNMSNMFNGCESLKKLFDFSKWKIDEVRYLNYMFSNCSILEEINGISNWKTNNVYYMNNMFQNCSGLKKFSDISNWDLTNVVDINFIFDGISTSIKTPKWDKSKINYHE